MEFSLKYIFHWKYFKINIIGNSIKTIPLFWNCSGTNFYFNMFGGKFSFYNNQVTPFM